MKHAVGTQLVVGLKLSNVICKIRNLWKLEIWSNVSQQDVSRDDLFVKILIFITITECSPLCYSSVQTISCDSFKDYVLMFWVLPELNFYFILFSEDVCLNCSLPFTKTSAFYFWAEEETWFLRNIIWTIIAKSICKRDLNDWRATC
jgi:hypothetical protein